jgi:hypothetical protein
MNARKLVNPSGARPNETLKHTGRPPDGFPRQSGRARVNRLPSGIARRAGAPVEPPAKRMAACAAQGATFDYPECQRARIVNSEQRKHVWKRDHGSAN